MGLDLTHPLLESLRRLDEQSTGGGSNTSYRRSFVQADLVLGKLLVTHNLGQDFNCVAVYDQTRRLVITAEVTDLNPNQIEIDLSSYPPIQGVWNLVVIA
jgi:hypothetical protein